MPENTQFHFLNDGKFFSSGLEEEIRHEALAAFKTIYAHIPEKALSVLFYHAPALTIPGKYIGGYCPDSLNVHIYLDTEYEDISGVIRNMMKRTLAHEYHHACRWEFPGYGETLAEAIISEGLADIFSMEAFPGEPPPWCTALKQQQTKALLEKASAWLDRKDYNHAAWFFGSGPDYPHWGGYTLGYEVVKNYLKTYRKESAASLVHATTTGILKESIMAYPSIPSHG